MSAHARRAGRPRRTVPYRTFLDGLVELRGWLLAEQISQVAMEATSSYRLPVWRVLEDGDVFERLLLVNARHVKHVPGRKTDVKGRQLVVSAAGGRAAGRQLRTAPTGPPAAGGDPLPQAACPGATAEIQRVDKTLEDAVVKLGAVASTTLTKSGRAMLEALIAGERDSQVLADLAKGRLRAKLDDLVRALDGRFDTHHAVHLRQLLDHIDWFEATITALDDRVADLTAPWGELIERLQTIPGVGRRTAEVIVAETGGDMSPWPTAGHLASWAGMSPGHNESGGKRRSGRTMTGDVWLADALIEASWSAVHAKDTYPAAKFWRLAGPRATANRRNKAAVAVGHKILIAAYHIMATPGEIYRDLGGDYFVRRDDPDRRRNRLVAQLASLGYHVALTPAA